MPPALPLDTPRVRGRVAWRATLRPLLLLACAQSVLFACAETAAPHHAAACRLEKAAEIPIRDTHGFLIVPGQIDGKPVTLLLDTGSSSSLVTPNSVARLGLEPDRRHRTVIHGTGGNITTQNATVQRIGFAGVDLIGQSVPVGPIASVTGAATEPDGLIGLDWLSHFDVEFDLPHGRMALYRAQSCSGDDIPWDGRKSTLIARKSRGGLLLLPVALEGKALWAVLDSGANGTTLRADSVARAGIALSGPFSVGRGVGVDGVASTRRIYHFAGFDIGAIHYRDVRLGVGTMSGVPGDMLLGTNWLRNARVWISFAAQTVTVQGAASRTEPE